MCGIAGYYSASNAADPHLVERMTDALAHRGPDASGVFCHEQFGIGHRRLSILDLSHSADQPMHSACGRYCISYNGEVYNYEEIAKDLDFPMRTTSDTEVILESFVKWGPEMVNRLNGMFALAILDKLEGKLYLFRDRIGIKPLFIYRKGDFFGFASELKAIVANAQFKLTVNYDAVPQFLHLGFIPEPQTIYNECQKFPSGHYGVFDRNSFHIQPYWKPEEHIHQQVLDDEGEAKERLRDLLLDSVKKRLISDVPFGTFLSGGIDSSLVTALAQHHSTEPVKTFSIGFAESTHDESSYAKLVSKRLGTIHHEYQVTENDALELIPSMLDHFDEPFADSSPIPTMLVSKMARQAVTMTLSGDGGDELFLGYGAYRWAERLRTPAWQLSRKPLSLILKLGSSREKRIAQLLKFRKLSNSHIFSQEQYFYSTKELGTILKENRALPAIENMFDEDFARNLQPSEMQAFFDLKYCLKDDLLTKVDRASMRYSLETRVPILDHRIVEFALNLSPKLKMKGNSQKYILKEILYEFVPKEMFNRPKWGFSIPLNLWLAGPLRPLLEDHLSQERVVAIGLFNWHHVEQLKRRFFNGENYLFNRLWLLICLHHWFHQQAGRVK